MSIIPNHWHRYFFYLCVPIWALAILAVVTLAFGITSAHGEGYRAPLSTPLLIVKHAPSPDEELKKLSLLFVALAKKHHREARMLPIKIESLGSNPNGQQVEGRCRWDDIVINADDWYKFDEWEREELVFHEYGHCILHRDHLNDEVFVGGDKLHKSLMHENMSNKNVYLMHRDYFINELFSQVGKLYPVQEAVDGDGEN